MHSNKKQKTNAYKIYNSISIIDFENNKIEGSTIKKSNLVVIKTTICYWDFNDRTEHGFSNQLASRKLLKYAEELEVKFLKKYEIETWFI